MDIHYRQGTSFPKQSDLSFKWVLLDASKQVTGRVASYVAGRLLGKHLPLHTPGSLIGDSVVIINADEIVFTGKKKDQKIYRHYSGYRGGLKTKKLKDIPSSVALMYAIKGMLPKNRYGRKLLKRVRIFSNNNHNMHAQSPVTVAIP